MHAFEYGGVYECVCVCACRNRVLYGYCDAMLMLKLMFMLWHLLYVCMCIVSYLCLCAILCIYRSFELILVCFTEVPSVG
ncbi:hypothetical protein EON63_20475 [archaeon]|nr:MAG: hypothetical protein EON63_20475 [archaeon]